MCQSCVTGVATEAFTRQRAEELMAQTEVHRYLQYIIPSLALRQEAARKLRDKGQGEEAKQGYRDYIDMINQELIKTLDIYAQEQ